MKQEEKIQLGLVEIIEDVLDIRITDYEEPFASLGLASADIPFFIAKVSQQFGVDVDVTSIFDYPSVNKYADYLNCRLEA